MAIMKEKLQNKKKKLSIIIKGHVDSDHNLCVLKDQYMTSSLFQLSSFWIVIWWDYLQRQSLFLIIPLQE